MEDKFKKTAKCKPPLRLNNILSDGTFKEIIPCFSKIRKQENKKKKSMIPPPNGTLTVN